MSHWHWHNYPAKYCMLYGLAKKEILRTTKAGDMLCSDFIYNCCDFILLINIKRNIYRDVSSKSIRHLKNLLLIFTNKS